MRIHIRTTPNTELVPFNHQPRLVGTIHKWLGPNDLHGKPALYSFSWLQRSKVDGKGFSYPHGASFFVSFYDDSYLKQVVKTIMSDTAMFCGLHVTDVTIEENPTFATTTRFQVASAIFIQRYAGTRNIHYTFENEEAGECLKETLLHKMQLAGLAADDALSIRFDTSAPGIRTKLLDYKGVKNKVSQCPVIVEAQPETQAFAWNVGLGSSTGIGFGAIY